MKTPHIQLTEPERTTLKTLLSKGSSHTKTFKRAMALRELDRGKGLTEVADLLSVSYQTVSNWRNRYRKHGLTMLHDQPRSGRPPVIDGTARAKVTALACSKPPEGHGQWSLRLLADKAVELGYCDHLSYNTVSEILKKTS